MNINTIKKNLVEKYGTDPKITYYYYTYNLVDYAGEKIIRRAFSSIKNQAEEVIVSDFSSDDETKDIAKEFGFKIVNSEKDGRHTFNICKVRNNAIYHASNQFIFPLIAFCEYPKNLDSYLKAWIKSNDITEKRLVLRYGWINMHGKKSREYGLSNLFYRPYLIAARGYDERLGYAHQNHSYGSHLLKRVFRLRADVNYLEGMDHIHHEKRRVVRKFRHCLGFNASRKLKNELLELLREDLKKNKKRIVNSFW